MCIRDRLITWGHYLNSSMIYINRFLSVWRVSKQKSIIRSVFLLFVWYFSCTFFPLMILQLFSPVKVRETAEEMPWYPGSRDWWLFSQRELCNPVPVLQPILLLYHAPRLHDRVIRFIVFCHIITVFQFNSLSQLIYGND